jgi:hypothetical protein
MGHFYQPEKASQGDPNHFMRAADLLRREKEE